MDEVVSKTIKNIFYKKLTFIKLIEAHDRAREGKNTRPEIIRFEMNLESNIINLLYKIKSKQYKIGKYREFYVYEPKERLIKSLPYIDRIVHQWYVEEFIKPFFIPRFIKDSYACLKDKGGHKAVLRMQDFMRRMKRKYKNYYVLKCDIKKYFYNIDKNILYSILEKSITDKELLYFSRVIIFDNDEKKGIPIGNYTSQFFANIYLNELDHYVKEDLGLPYYIRYMDDFILLLPTKDDAKQIKEKIKNFLEQNLKLELNAKSKYYPSKMGIDFCGYRIFETHLLIRKRSKAKIKKLIKSWNCFYKEGNLNLENVIQRWNAWRGHISHANTYHLENKYLDKILFKESLKTKKETSI